VIVSSIRGVIELSLQKNADVQEVNKGDMRNSGTADPKLMKDIKVFADLSFSHELSLAPSVEPSTTTVNGRED
jgi:hypothetical protein